MAWMKRDDERVKSFEKVREQELKYIVKRQPLGKDDQLPKEDVVAERLIGLSFSGGGSDRRRRIWESLRRFRGMGILRLADYSQHRLWRRLYRRAASPLSCPSIAITRRTPVTRSSSPTRCATS
jgi:hypothetical protein